MLPDTLEFRLDRLRREIAAAALAAGRDRSSVHLLAVSKTHGPEAVQSLIALGHRHFGENRVQEAVGKFGPLRAFCPDLELHLIGALQTNKVPDAVEHFEVIETVDRPRLAEALAREIARRPGRLKSCLIEVNTGEEPQKAGVLPHHADAFIVDCRDRLGLPVAGLMTIPPAGEEPAPYFALLRELARRHDLPVLSMGMSGDFAIAIQQGATEIRIGSALFGTRLPDPKVSLDP